MGRTKLTFFPPKANKAVTRKAEQNLKDKVMSEDVYFRKMGEQKSQKSDFCPSFIGIKGELFQQIKGMCAKKKQKQKNSVNRSKKKKRPFLVKQKNRGALYMGNRKTKGKNY